MNEVCLACVASLACITGIAEMRVEGGRSGVWFTYGPKRESSVEIYRILDGPVEACPRMKEIWAAVEREMDESYY